MQSSGSRPLREALANYNYRLFLLGQFVSQSGAWIQRIAQAWLVLELTESPVALGLLTAIQYLPILLFSLFAGTLADRYAKRALLGYIQLGATAQALVLAGLVFSGAIELWHVYVLALAQGVTSALEQPVRHSFAPELLGREYLTTAIALNSAVHGSGRIFGPAVGGFAVAALGLGGAFLLNAASYLLVLNTLLLMRASGLAKPGPRRQENVLRQLADAFAYAAGSPPITFSLGVLTCLAIFGFNYMTFMPLLARYALELGPSGYGLLNAALGLGALAGALGMARVGRTNLSALSGAGILFSLLLAAVGFSPWFGLSMALMVGLGLAGVIFTTTVNSHLQTSVPEQMRGRVMGMYSLLLAGMTPPGAAFTGALADLWGIRVTLGVEALICMGGLLLGLGYLAEMRRRGRWSAQHVA